MIPELLSPAGDWDALRAAVANGANAVYFGLPQFNARHRATNFAADALPEIMSFLHAHNVKGFVTLNTLIFSDELPAVVDYLHTIASTGVDAVIVQDLGLVRLIKKLVPSLPIHASTQMTLTEPRGIAILERMGVERVILARELSLAEIRKVTSQTTMPVEVFVHGALCVAYSGQCLTSEALGGRSANRGQCAQACRLPYELYVDGCHHELGERAYLLSPQDLAAYDLIDDLIEAGVSSFKIEGRLKSAAYVAAATQTYRAAIDAACAKQAFQLSREQQRELAQTFSRGFTPGFLEGVNHQQLVQGRFPKSRGVFIGVVCSVFQNTAVVALSEADPQLLKAGDGIVFDLGNPEQPEPGGRLWKVRQLPRTSSEPLHIEIQLEETFDAASRVPIGSRVWKTDDPALNRRLEQSYARDQLVHRVPIDVLVNARIGAPLEIRVCDPDNNHVQVTWPGPLQLARKQPLRIEVIRDQWERLGDTPFCLGKIECSALDAVMVPKSVLNDLRRQAVQQLVALRRSRQRHSIAEPNALESMREQIAARQATGEYGVGPELTVLTRTLDQLDVVLAWQPPHGLPRPSIVYCDFEDTRRYRDAVIRARSSGLRIGLATLRIIKPGEEGFLNPIVTAQPDAVLIRNLASLAFFQERCPGLELLGDFALNVANELTAATLIDLGLRRLVPSYDLNWEQLLGMLRRCPADWFEPVIHQHMPMFHMEHCVFAAFLSTGKDFRDCGRPCDRHRVELRDRVGARFPVIPDTGCRNTVFNSVAQSAAEYIARMKQLGLRRFRVELLRETPDQVPSLLEQYGRVIAGMDDGRDTWRKLQAKNQLGVTRGTLQLV